MIDSDVILPVLHPLKIIEDLATIDFCLIEHWLNNAIDLKSGGLLFYENKRGIRYDEQVFVEYVLHLSFLQSVCKFV